MGSAAENTVCIIGAGPAGLVAAKNLLHNAPPGTFKVTIFDGQPRLGGLWPESPLDNSGHIHPMMITNQSRHTVQFSDWSYKPYVQQLPRAWQVGEYLREYAEAYLGLGKDGKKGGVEWRLGTRVDSAEPMDGDSGKGWKVKAGGEERRFEYLLVASGYFGKPVIPKALQGGGNAVPVIHSSTYRNLESLLGKDGGKGCKILVVGGQMSGVEVAGTIATHLSAAANGIGPSSVPNVEKYAVHHLVQRPVWVFPTYTTPVAAAKAPAFMPLDLPSYNLAVREQPLTNKQGSISVEGARFLNSSIYQPMLGTDQSEYAAALALTEEEKEAPPFIAVSDPYLEFVRSGLISVSRGRLESMDGTTASCTDPTGPIDDIAAIILATGFDATHSVDYLPASIRETLSETPDDIDNTFHLAFHSTHHPKVPNLGFVGFYRSPYWGVMEMQARFMTAVWSAGGFESPALSPYISLALKGDTSIARSLSLRWNPRSAQFPMGDYPWLMDQFATALNIKRLDLPRAPPRLPPLHVPLDFLSPSRYFTEITTLDELAAVARDAQAANLLDTSDTIWSAPTNGSFIAKAVFRALQGDWKLRRTIISNDSFNWSGTFEGTAKFLLREGTIHGREKEFSKSVRAAAMGVEESDNKAEAYGQDLGYEYLYIEQGTFTPSTGGFGPIQTSKSYVWRYDELTDKLSTWFVHTTPRERRKTVDYLFHELAFKLPWDRNGIDYEGEWEVPVVTDRGWEASSGHLCIRDYYDVKYEFGFRAVGLEGWSQEYSVKGPKKDYWIRNKYERK